MRLNECSTKTGLPVDKLQKRFDLYEKDGILVTPYYDKDGILLFNKYRKGNDRWYDSGSKLEPYGLNYLPDDGERLFLCEGESDLWALSLQGIYPVLGIPGTQTFKPEWVDYVKDFKSVYIVFDNDEAGRKGTEKVIQILTEEGYPGKAYVIQLPNGIKDVNDLYKDSPESFKATFDELVKNAKLATIKKEKPPKPKDDTPKEIVKYKSFVDDGYHLYEQTYDGKDTYYLKYDPDNDDVERVDVVIVDGTTYKPIQGEEVEKKVIKLPSGIREYGTTNDLIVRIQKYFRRYLDIDEDYLKLASYYVLTTYVYDRLHTLCYLRALGDTGCGKSRFLNVIGNVCYKSISLSGATPAVTFRIIDQWGGTFVNDEADMKSSDEANDMIKIFNNGFEKGVFVPRCDTNNPDIRHYYDVYCPKILATRKSIQDTALEARCFTYTMQETSRTDIPITLDAEFFKEQQELRNMLLLYRFRNYREINPLVSIDLDNVEPRIRQISSAILPVIANDENALNDFKRIISKHQRNVIEQRSSSPDGQAVSVLFDLIENAQTIEISTGDKLLTITAQQIADQLGYQWTSQRVGQILRSLKLETKSTKHLGDTKRFIKYDEAQLATLRKRYIPVDDDIDGRDLLNAC